MHSIKLYNTAARAVEPVRTHEEGKLTMYTCGPTVYHYAHIGNLRTYIMEDVLEKLFVYDGYEVRRAMNITDVGHLTSDADTGEDKMLAGARREGKSAMEIAKFYTDAFFADCEKLNIKRPEIVVPATACIPDFIELIQTLFDKGYAYTAGGNVYFDTSKVEDYYCLTGHSADDLMVGVRDDVTEDTNKRNKTDFVLWFTDSKFGEQELRWDSPWGYGYPGWHIECSSISLKNLGEYLDIHAGGVDNIFPHHTNEIAQSEAAIGHPWCGHWFHPRHLNDKSGKMSKSKGGILTVSVLEEKGYKPLAYRYFCLQSHYMKQLVFSWESLDNAASAYDKLLSRIAAIKAEAEKNGGEPDLEKVGEYRERFIETVGNDLNTSLGLTLLYEVIKADIDSATKLAVIEDFDRVLSLDLTSGKAEEEAPAEDLSCFEGLLKLRAEAKKNRDWAKADAIRDKIKEAGFMIVDTPDGAVLKKI
ncbi:MAG: cysteine--tRNA ligase [Clostridiales bacterium]|nr:cysteine--tRNA ligase [Clostridiales bacterium]